MRKDSQLRSAQITQNNTNQELHQELREKAKSLNYKYIAVVDEIGEKSKIYHTHIYIKFTNSVRFSTLKNIFPMAHIEKAQGTALQNRNYLLKKGERNEKKSGTTVEGTFEEFGDIPEESNVSDASNVDWSDVFQMVEDGADSLEVIRKYPSAIKNINALDHCIEKHYSTLADENRHVEVVYIYGKTGTGKTYNVMNRRDLNVYRVTGYEHPFDKYLHEDTLLFDEFRSQLPISDMLIYLDGYRKTFLSARYNPKTALYNKVFIISNVSLEEQYQDVQRTSPESWDAFLRRIDQVERYVGFGEVELYESVDDYFAGKFKFHKITPDEIAENPFTKGGDSCA